MKKIITLSLIFTLNLKAQTLSLSEYNLNIPDISEGHHSKELLFQSMNKKLVRTKDSICSNRAHVWSYDFYKNGILAPKIFLFFTKKTGYFGGTTWWYHVSPLINEKGKWWAMDAGLPGRIKKPLEVSDWLKEFNGVNSNCKEIHASDENLIELMFSSRTFPETVSQGTFNCYYRITPPWYWVPSQVAKNLLGRDTYGRIIHFSRDEFKKSEVLEACLETSTNPIGRLVNNKKAKCSRFIE